MSGIVVGVDGSADADAALRWAMSEAELRDWPLTALLAWDPGHRPPAVTELAGDAGDEQVTEAAARQVLHAAISRATEPPLPSAVDEQVRRGNPAQTLLDASAEADLLVLGLHGTSRKRRLLAGSVTDVCLHEAATATVVVRAGHVRPDGPVVVGVDGSAASAQALRAAAAQARARGAVLRAVHAWMPVMPLYPGLVGAIDSPTFEKAAQALLDECVDQLDEETSAGLRVERVLVEDAAAHALIRQSADASLVVVGSRGLGGFASLLLGSVSHQCVHHAACPVAVIRPTD